MKSLVISASHFRDMGPMSLATLLPKNSLLQISLKDVEPGYYGSLKIEN